MSCAGMLRPWREIRAKKIVYHICPPVGPFEQQNDIHMFLLDQAASGGCGEGGVCSSVSETRSLPTLCPRQAVPAQLWVFGLPSSQTRLPVFRPAVRR